MTCIDRFKNQWIKHYIFAAAFMLLAVGAYTQGNGIAGITETTNMVTSYFAPGTK